ncbi:hypothetical protein ACH5RR_017761 [Cinchona calisaya]|uniref:Retroviral polymerase SH3-like domain-containing protein n=1 Tax=Cinchona calisaya TaxID=153742 RepID=A0ABD2ZJI1_9GENT
MNLFVVKSVTSLDMVLRTAGIAIIKCFPYLRGYAKNKFEPRSFPHIFLGYSEIYKGHRCLHSPSNRVYTSRHVIFDIAAFPFGNLVFLYMFNVSNNELIHFSEWMIGVEENYSMPSLDDNATSSLLHENSSIISSRSQDKHNSTILLNKNMINLPEVEIPNVSAPLSTSRLLSLYQNLTSSDPSGSLNLQPNQQAVDDSSPDLRRRSQAHKCNPKYFGNDYCLMVAAVPSEPKSTKSALKRPGWVVAMHEEIKALHGNQT